MQQDCTNTFDETQRWFVCDVNRSRQYDNIVPPFVGSKHQNMMSTMLGIVKNVTQDNSR